MASSLILIGSPRELHIPYFAMGVRWLRENRVERLDLGTDLARLVGRRCAAWIKARTERDRIELMATRNYAPPQTTFCATWLVFGNEAVATEFLHTYPQHRLDGRIAKLEADREPLAAKLQDRLKRGDFDLGRVGDERQRENLARRYVEGAEALRGLWSQVKLLERAWELAAAWPSWCELEA
jgi:hypothetical protein